MIASDLILRIAAWFVVLSFDIFNVVIHLKYIITRKKSSSPFFIIPIALYILLCGYSLKYRGTLIVTGYPEYICKACDFAILTFFHIVTTVLPAIYIRWRM